MESTSGSENNDKDKIVTMVDVLNEERELEEQALAVLGAGSDSHCTYSEGYVYRQPLFACLTCNPVQGGNLAGFCLGCSYKCHAGHEVIELYTKRNFRCDCGNSLFPNNKCQLLPVKDPKNNNNLYNHNFKGLYCVCNKPYPNPNEDQEDDEMIQCIICEDWYHKNHLEPNKFPNQFDELICMLCMRKIPFLWKYVGLDFAALKEAGTLDEDSDVEDSDGIEVEPDPENVGEYGSDADCPRARLRNKKSGLTYYNENTCYLTMASEFDLRTGATVWPYGWRRMLCHCSKCLNLYIEKNIIFLTSDKDSIRYYEMKNCKDHPASLYERGMKALSDMDRFQQMHALENYAHMRNQLMGYLKKFADKNKVVRAEDIWEFFSRLNTTTKKRRLDIPASCR